MTGGSKDQYQRGVHATLSLLSRKWRSRILIALQNDGPIGFNELREDVPGISGKVLSENLEELQNAGAVERVVVRESPLRVEYDLTDAGADLEPVFDHLAEWGQNHGDRSIPCVLIADGDRRLTALYRQWLEPAYAVRHSHDVASLRRHLDGTVDVVVFDRGLPGVARFDVPALVADVDATCRTIMVTAERPDFDVVDVACDSIIRKPATKSTLSEAIKTQIERRGEPLADRNRHALEACRAVLEESYSSAVLNANDRYQHLCSRLEERATSRSE